MPKDRDEDLPSTLQRSPAKAKRTWREAHDSAVDTYGEGERAHRTAYSALKHSFEKKGDRWVPKGRKGPSDPQARKGGAAARRSRPASRRTASRRDRPTASRPRTRACRAGGPRPPPWTWTTPRPDPTWPGS